MFCRVLLCLRRLPCIQDFVVCVRSLVVKVGASFTSRKTSIRGTGVVGGIAAGLWICVTLTVRCAPASDCSGLLCLSSCPGAFPLADHTGPKKAI